MLSKSQLLSYRQCPRKLWLEKHRPDAAIRDEGGEQRQQDGNALGELARSIFDKDGSGVLIDRGDGRLVDRIEKTRQLLRGNGPIFEAVFSADGGLCYADVVALDDDGQPHIIEVKSSSKVKDYHLDDAAIQWHLASASGNNIASISIAHVDRSWTYAGDENYDGLLHQEDVTELAKVTAKAVPEWLRDAAAILANTVLPDIRRGGQCTKPHDCGFEAHCLLISAKN